MLPSPYLAPKYNTRRGIVDIIEESYLGLFIFLCKRPNIRIVSRSLWFVKKISGASVQIGS